MKSLPNSKNSPGPKFSRHRKNVRRALLCSLLLSAPILASGPKPDIDSALAAQAKGLLEKIIGTDAEITVKTEEEVTWNNGAMGCPQPEGVYSQALIPGYRIILIANDREYAFHGRNNGEPFYCQTPESTKKY
ncbi:hypothetical protein NBRC116493_31470 [Aurantivibrio infirmus]